MLSYLSIKTTESLLLSSYGLSLVDYYWVKPVNEYGLTWEKINFFDNEFSDDIGNLLTGESVELHEYENISKMSPSASVIGEMKKKWVRINGSPVLLKVNKNNNGQQCLNEVLACELHRLLSFTNYVKYSLVHVVLSDAKALGCTCPSFTDSYNELVTAYQLIRSYKQAQDTNSFETLINLAIAAGCYASNLRSQLEYMIMTDFILSNTDRHFNNFGFLRKNNELTLSCIAPLYDAGNSLFYNTQVPVGEDLYNIKISSFAQTEVRQLKLVDNKHILKLDALSNFSNVVYKALIKVCGVTGERAEHVAKSIDAKISMLDDFYNGCKLWKTKKYRW